MSEIVQFVIYENPKDFPNKWVVRRWVINQEGFAPGSEAVVCSSLEHARLMLPLGLYNLGRFSDDDPVIKEVWI